MDASAVDLLVGRWDGSPHPDIDLAAADARGDATAAPNARSPRGTNLTGISHWSTEIPFVDLFMTSRPWISGSTSTWDDKRPFDRDSRGWIRSLKPRQIARTLPFWGGAATKDRFPRGTCLVLFGGKGTLGCFDAANRDPRMGSVRAAYLSRWKKAGGRLLMHFADCGAQSVHGRWGALKYLDQPRSAAPRHDA